LIAARGVELWNLYGPTETTVWSTCARITDTANGIRIGKPIANTTVYILDAQSNLCPIGVPGELCIGGVGVTLGYWNRPELTAERFIPDPFSATPGAALYRSGDRARWCNDGTLEHLDGSTSKSSCAAFVSKRGRLRLVSHSTPPSARSWSSSVRTSRGPTTRCLPRRRESACRSRGAVARAPPREPAGAHGAISLREPGRLALTPNGKLDRKALPAPLASLPGDASFLCRANARPRKRHRTDLERCAEAWKGLASTTISSIWAVIRCCCCERNSRLRASLQPDLPFVALMQYPTVRTLASYLSGTAEQSVVPAAAADRARKQREAMLRQRSIRGQR